MLLAPMGFDAQITQLAGDFWYPRVGGAFLGAAVWAMFGFFNGIGRPRATLLVTCVTALANALFNQLFIFRLGWGIAGSGWATTLAQGLGLTLALVIFLRPELRQRYQSDSSWRPRASLLREQLRLGVPMGLLSAADMLGFAIFQMMQVRLGTVAGAATQVVMMLTSVAYMPGYGIALAGTTLVGQCIGAGSPGWASRVGSRVILLAAVYMGGIGVLLALAGPELLPLFTGAHDADAPATVALGTQLLWIAAGYHLFDGVNLGSALCLRGAGDAVVPAALVIDVLAAVRAAGARPDVRARPGLGAFPAAVRLGCIGGWIAVLIYIMVLGSTLLLRWRSQAWWNVRPVDRQ
jgi:MATE family multidrug resistance protein